MEGTIGEIRLFAGNFAPKNWAFCTAQTVAIQSNTALFSILGITYGGDGKTTFGLPDFRGRAAVSIGTGPGLTPYVLGEATGSQTVTLISTELPAHTHTAVVTAGTGGSAAISINAAPAGTQPTPGGALLSADGNLNLYAPSGTSPAVALNSSAIQLSSVTAPTPTVAIGTAGGNQPHNNIQPYMGMNFIICMYGTFPYRG